MTRLSAYCCIRCGARYGPDHLIDSRGCPTCYEEAPANLRVVYDEPQGASDILSVPASLPPSMWRYAQHLPFCAAEAVTLGEGLTPLLPAPAFGRAIGLAELYIKDESRNPTWSHKDRFSSVAVTAARQFGAETVATASSGNAGASLAAYAQRAGLNCVVATFAGTAGPMLAQIRKMGATVVPFSVKSHRWEFLEEGAARHGWFVSSPYRSPLVGSHPLGIEGYKTLAFEIVEQLRGKVPDWCVMPVCYGDALAGLWYGFCALLERGSISSVPRLVAAEVHGSLAAALSGIGDRVSGTASKAGVQAVSIGAPASTFQALNALRQTQGAAVPVGDCDLIALQERLACTEGLFGELASVAPFAAISLLRGRNVIKEQDCVVTLLTASGLKDLDRSVPGTREDPAFGSPVQAWEHLSADEFPSWRAKPASAEIV